MIFRFGLNSIPGNIYRLLKTSARSLGGGLLELTVTLYSAIDIILDIQEVRTSLSFPLPMDSRTADVQGYA